MQEEAMALSDDEISDEVVMIESNQSVSGKSTYPRNADVQKRDSESIDDQLKAVGLYEEGLSAEQKEELLAVIAASEKSAKQEQSMREKAREWQKKIFSDDVDYNQLVPSVSSGSQTSLQPAYVNVVNESEVESSMQMLNIEGSSESSLTDLPSSAKILLKKEQEALCKLRSSTTSDSIGVASKPISRVSKNVKISSESEETEVVQTFSVAHTSQEKDEVVDIQIDLRKQKKELEKLLAEWCPSSLPGSSLITRDMQKDNKVPYNCDGENCGQHIISAIDELHNDISQQQRTSIDFMQWGYPITVGRAYSTRSTTRIRGPDSETSDGVYNFNFPMPEQSAQTNSKNSSYLRLREFDKKCQAARKANSTNTVKTDSILKKKTADSLKVINAKSVKNTQCESVTDSETECKEIEIGTTSSDETLVSTGLTQSTSSVLYETSHSVDSDIYVCDSETDLPKDSHKQSLSENDFSTVKNGPISNLLKDPSLTDSVENCDSPIIIVDDDPHVEQENVVCVSEKTLRRKRMNSKVPVSSPSKRIHL